MAPETPCPRCGSLIDEEARFCPYCGGFIQSLRGGPAGPAYPTPYYYQPSDYLLYYHAYQMILFYWNQLPPWAQLIIQADLYTRGVTAAYDRLKSWLRS